MKSSFKVFPLQVRILFLQWIPWLLRMSRPGEKITRKTILIQNKMKEMDMKENSSKSLLANVLDMDDDFRPSPLNHHVFPQTPHLPKSSQPNTASSLFRCLLCFSRAATISFSGSPSPLPTTRRASQALVFTGSSPPSSRRSG